MTVTRARQTHWATDVLRPESWTRTPRPLPPHSPPSQVVGQPGQQLDRAVGLFANQSAFGRRVDAKRRHCLQPKYLQHREKLRCWPRDSRFVISITTLGMDRCWSLGNFIHPKLAQFTQPQISTNIVGKVPEMNQCPFQEGQYNCSMLIALWKQGLKALAITMISLQRFLDCLYLYPQYK